MPSAVPLTLAAITARIHAHRAHHWVEGTEGRQAGVAVVLQERAEGSVEVLFIRRAERSGDPWSGHMAFPGGHREPSDLNLSATAARETAEEIGLDLDAHGQLLGELDQTRAQPRRPATGQSSSRIQGLVIGPIAFALNGVDPPLTPNYEVAEALWVPLPQLMSNRLHRLKRIEIRGHEDEYNGFEVNERCFIWGLTYRMLKQFFRVLDPTWESCDAEEFDEFRR